MDLIIDFFNQNTTILLIASLGFNLLVLIFLIINLSLTSNLRDRYRRLIRGSDGGRIENILFDHMDRVEAVHSRLDEVEKAMDLFNNRLSFCIQNIGIVRYSAFDDTGSDLSYSIALLDDNQDGIIITGIHGRRETASYAKPIKNGLSNYNLSVEEEQALARAKDNALDRVNLVSSRQNS